MKTFKQIHEKALSVAQQKLMALALQHKRGELEADKVTPEVEKLADSMSEKELEDFASTKHKDLPKKIEEKVRIRDVKKAEADRRKTKSEKKFRVGDKVDFVDSGRVVRDAIVKKVVPLPAAFEYEVEYNAGSGLTPGLVPDKKVISVIRPSDIKK